MDRRSWTETVSHAFETEKAIRLLNLQRWNDFIRLTTTGNEEVEDYVERRFRSVFGGVFRVINAHG